MDEQTKGLIKQTYYKAISTFDIEYLLNTVAEADIDTNNPECKNLLKELDKEFGIY